MCLQSIISPRGPHVTITHDAIGQSQIWWGPLPLPQLPLRHHTGTPSDMFRLFQLGPQYRGCKAPLSPKMVKLVCYVARIVGKWVVGIRLKCLLVWLVFLGILMIQVKAIVIKRVFHLNCLVLLSFEDIKIITSRQSVSKTRYYVAKN